VSQRSRGDPGGSRRARHRPDGAVEVECCPVGPLRPEPEEHRAHEDEPAAAVRSSEPVEEALEAVAREQALVVVSHLLRAVEQARGDRGGEVRLAAHAIESR
jgi:hypothetical protein